MADEFPDLSDVYYRPLFERLDKLIENMENLNAYHKADREFKVSDVTGDAITFDNDLRINDVKRTAKIRSDYVAGAYSISHDTRNGLWNENIRIPALDALFENRVVVDSHVTITPLMQYVNGFIDDDPTHSHGWSNIHYITLIYTGWVSYVTEN